VDDDALVRIVAAIVKSPCAKKGKKGETFFVRVPVDSKIKSGKIFNHEKAGVIDFLYRGRLTVLPPTIHPETRQPYRWTGTSLLDVDPEVLPVFDDKKLRLLRLVIGSEGPLFDLPIGCSPRTR
jgi:hypothetical protein